MKVTDYIASKLFANKLNEIKSVLLDLIDKEIEHNKKSISEYIVKDYAYRAVDNISDLQKLRINVERTDDFDIDEILDTVLRMSASYGIRTETKKKIDSLFE